jgi:hypothetical protein
MTEMLDASDRTAHADLAEDAPRPAGACAVWEFFSGLDHALVSETAAHRYEEPDFSADVVARTRDSLTVDVVGGVARYDHRILYFVEGHGVFEQVARDVRMSRGEIRVRLVLRAI